MSFEEKVRQHKELSQKLAELEDYKKQLAEEILQLMPKGLKIVAAGNYQVKRHSRISIKTTIEEARAFDAVKMEEMVDKDRLKELHSIGHPIPNITESEYIIITAKKSS